MIAFGKSALTIDLEDGINIAMRDNFGISIPPTERVITNTERLLDLFDTKNTKATFFVLGQVAESYPGLIRKIYNCGHEIGSHGYSHVQFFKLNADRARAEIVDSKKVIEDIIGDRIKSFRSPAFSIIPQTSWALNIIAEAGFEYDSSIMPNVSGRYGWKGFDSDIQKLMLPNGLTITEFPLTVVSLLGKNIPACGGGYLRLSPYYFTKWAFRKTLSNRPVSVYLHPYETDTVRYPQYYFKEMQKMNLLKRIKIRSYWINRNTVMKKLEFLLDTFHFDRMDNIINEFNSDKSIVVSKIR